MTSVVQNQQLNPGNGTDTTIAVTLPGSVTAGSLVLVAVSWEPLGSRAVSTISDGTANVYSLIDTVNDTTQDQQTSWYYVRQALGGWTTVTVTFTLTVAFRRMMVAELSTTTDVLDQHTTKGRTATATGTDGVFSNAITPTTNNQLIVGLIEVHGNPAIAPGTGYAEIADVSGVAMEWEFKDLATPVSTQATWTLDAAGSFYLSYVASFKSSSQPGLGDDPPFGFLGRGAGW